MSNYGQLPESNKRRAIFDGRSELEEQKIPDQANRPTEKNERASEDVMARRKYVTSRLSYLRHSLGERPQRPLRFCLQSCRPIFTPAWCGNARLSEPFKNSADHPYGRFVQC